MSAADRAPSLTGPDTESERRHGFRAVGLMVSKLAAPVVAKRGGGGVLVRLKADWAAIIGPDWALVAWPAALGRDGALKLCTAPAAAIELQHRAPLLIDRINLYFGRPAVTRLILVQGVLPHPPQPGIPTPRLLNAGEAEALEGRLSAIADPALRTALARLGRAVIGVGR
jgi:hypothetical protein